MTDPRLIAAVEALIRAAERPGHIPLIGISGAQGSGKTTLARAAAKVLGAAHLSLDDVYRTLAERERMARDIHPLFITRGPPGTHDLSLMTRTVAVLRAAGPAGRTPLPAFDKLADDRRPASEWPVFAGSPRAVLIDGWVIGARPQAEADLKAPVNDLERDEDGDGTWRRAVNRFLTEGAPMLTDGFDAVLFLKAPSFTVVPDWRREQEAALRRAPPGMPDEAERARIGRFVAHYERLTRHMLTGGARAETVVRLDERRGIHRIDTNPGQAR